MAISLREAPAAPLTVPHQQLRLKNGLTVILHQDLRLPRVVVNVLYRVGARDDPPGRTGVAHLFEHLMFMGTRRIPEGKIDLLMEEMGGSNNAFTSEDVTDYYDVGPAHLLETLLWIEADRMATLAQAFSQKKLDLQREVVLNERRQSYENTPYGPAHLQLPGLLYPKGHPYSWPIIGASEDLRAVTVGDLRELFRRYYSPRNASLVVAGRFDPERVRALVERYFAWIPAAAPPSPPRPRLVPLRREIRRSLTDRVELPRLHWVWYSPAFLGPGDAELDLAGSILSVGKLSRLHRELVYEKRLALQVSADQESRALGSQFVIEVTARQGVDLGRLEREVDRVLQRFLARPPTRREVERARNGYETRFVGRMERLAGRAEWLNFYYAHVGQPDYFEADLARYRAATPASIHRWSRQVLQGAQRVVLTVLPAEQGK